MLMLNVKEPKRDHPEEQQNGDMNQQKLLPAQNDSKASVENDHH
jgi:hypothetical protein